MRKTLAVTAAIMAALAVSPALSQSRSAPAYVAAALNDAARPQADRDQDALRKPADMLAFAGIKPGTTIAEWLPGGGYFTRVFSKAVGANGHVYALTGAGPRSNAIKAIGADANYSGNVTVEEGNLGELMAPKPVDVVWTSRNYHDLPEALRAQVNQHSFEMLKPGGLYIVLDHSAIVGTGDYDMAPGHQFHRFDENLVKLEAIKAGFEYVGESNVLRNRKDDRLEPVFDSSIRGDTDQFVLKFRKPK